VEMRHPDVEEEKTDLGLTYHADARFSEIPRMCSLEFRRRGVVNTTCVLSGCCQHPEVAIHTKVKSTCCYSLCANYILSQVTQPDV
jgi:hypothetical protein